MLIFWNRIVGRSKAHGINPEQHCPTYLNVCVIREFTQFYWIFVKIYKRTQHANSQRRNIFFFTGIR